MNGSFSALPRPGSTAALPLPPLPTTIPSSPSPPSTSTWQNSSIFSLKEIGVQRDHIVIDPYTGALGYGFEYSYSAMERIRFSALKGDSDLAMPMICSAIDSLTIKEVREAEPAVQDEMAIQWEFYTGIAAAAAGAEIICVRHPGTIPLLRKAFTDMKKSGPAEVH